MIAQTTPGHGVRGELAPGEVLDGRYEIVGVLGRGGMGAVYLAMQRGLERKVAVKTVRADQLRSGEHVARFEREVRIVKDLTHPNTVRVYDLGRDGAGATYLVMEYIEGRSLRAVLKDHGPISLPVAVDIGRQVLRSLIEAHGKGVVHRDIKPDNIMLCDQSGTRNFVKVLDFGLARRDDDRAFQTASGQSLGTANYMAPEQVSGRPVDARTDLYALGHTLLEAVAGRPAYGGGSFEAAMRHLEPEPVELPEGLERTAFGGVLRVALEKDPARRFQSAAAMLEALAHAEGLGESEAGSLRPMLREVTPTGSMSSLELGPTRGSSWAESGPVFVRRGRRLAAWTLGTALLAGAVAGAWGLLGGAESGRVPAVAAVATPTLSAGEAEFELVGVVSVARAGGAEAREDAGGGTTSAADEGDSAGDGDGARRAREGSSAEATSHDRGEREGANEEEDEDGVRRALPVHF